jgi:hypothetical protein
MGDEVANDVDFEFSQKREVIAQHQRDQKSIQLFLVCVS